MYSLVAKSWRLLGKQTHTSGLISRQFHYTSLVDFARVEASHTAGPILRLKEDDLLKVSIIGRPNVGKSALFNRLVRRREALIHNTPGDHVTRDIREGIALAGKTRYKVLDTPGLEVGAGRTVTIPERARELTGTLLSGSDAALLVVDGQHGTHPLDAEIVQWLRRNTSLPVILVANKCENYFNFPIPGPEDAAQLGMGVAIPVSAETAFGMHDLSQAIESTLTTVRERGRLQSSNRIDDSRTAPTVSVTGARPADVDADVADADDADVDALLERALARGSDDEDAELAEASATPPMQLVIVGRPNVGKSTLVNQMLGAERVLTGPERGLTRDSIRLPAEYQGSPVWLVDTAGWERRTLLEKKGLLASLGSLEAKRSMNRAHVVALLLDAEVYLQEGRMLRSEVALARRATEEGKALIIVLNKSDVLSKIGKPWAEIREKLQSEVERWLPQIGRVPCHAASALTGEGVRSLMPAFVDLYDKWNRRISTGRLNRWLMKVALRSPRGGLSRVRYLTQVKTRPPCFTLFLRGKGEFTDVDARTVTNGLREDFEFDGIPLRIVQRRQQWEDHLKGKLGEKKNSSVHRFGTSRGGASNMGKDSAMFHTSVRLLTPNKGNQTKGRSRHKHRKSAGRSLTKARFDVSTFDDEN